MVGPLQSEGQRLGAEAQNAFATLVVKNGHIWDPTAANADFGIDGRVAVVKDGVVTGVEFAVQIKGTAKVTPARDGSVLLGRVKTSTVRYWFSRLTPTLLALYDASREEFHIGWAHHVNDIFKRVAELHSKEIVLRIKGFKLTSNSWRTIVEQSEVMHAMSTSGTSSLETLQQGTMGLLYLQTSGVADVLAELASLIAYDAGFSFMADGTVERRRMSSNDDASGTGDGADVWAAFNLVKMLTGLLDVFVRSKSGNTEEMPGILLLVEIVKQLQVHAPPILRNLEEPRDDAPYWVTVDGEKIVAQLLTVLMHLRDFNRQVRMLLLPRSVEMEAAMLNDAQAKSFRMFCSLRDHSIAPATDLAKRWS